MTLAVAATEVKSVGTTRLGDDGAMRFEKWQALGNDYVIVEREALPWELDAERIRRICEPHFGVGADGILVLAPAGDDRYVAELRIFNPDGSEAELSGNGAREAVLYLRASGWTAEDEFTIITKAGEVRPRINGPNEVAMAIGRAAVRSADYPSGPEDGTGTLSAGGREWAFRHVNVGNPQCVIEVGDELEQLEISAFGGEIEAHELFPNRTNVSFIRADGSDVRARIFERGVGETLASGTGASGAAVAAFLGGAPSPLTVRLDGGSLTVDITADLDVTLTGTASRVYAGELDPCLVTDLAATSSSASRAATKPNAK
jgi:diaminopimelate epimerase